MNCYNGNDNKPLQIKRGTKRALFKTNPILLEGQPCVETDTLLMKIGNGITRYNSLPYVGEQFKGVDGKSAYELWKKETGNPDMTKEEFMNTMVTTTWGTF